MRWSGAAALFLAFAWTQAAALDSAVYPPTPPHPRSVAECVTLAQDYDRTVASLLRRYDDIGIGRGPQVAAGPCCRQEAASPGWCRTFQSHAAAWEAIQCAAIAKRNAVAECRRAVAVAVTQDDLSIADLGPYAKAGALSGRNEIETAQKVLETVEIVEELRSWIKAGNSTADLPGLVQKAAERAAKFDGTLPFVLDSEEKRLKYVPIANAVIREWAARMLNGIGIVHTQVISAFDRQMNALDREFPGLVRVSSPGKSPTPPTSRLASPAAGSCRDAVERKIGECDAAASIDPQRRANDFSFYQLCRAQYADELAHCN